MVKHCRRCGLPRRRPLLTPDGKMFSFPGFSVRRHRGLLLASGAALCCCCADQDGRPTSDISSDWDSGATFGNLDEWPADDATTQAVTTIGPGALDQDAAVFGISGMTDNEGLSHVEGRVKITQVSGSGGAASMTVYFLDNVTVVSSANLPWSAGVDGVWTTLTGGDSGAAYTTPRLQVSAATTIAGSTFECAVSAMRAVQTCP